MEDKVYKVTKMGEDKIPIKPVEEPKLEGGKKHKKTLKTFPRGILKTAKIKGVADPAKHPNVKKIMKKHTIRLLTESGSSHRRKTIKRKLDKMSDQKIKDLVVRAGLSKGNGPPVLLRQIAEGGMLSGFISSY
jgi:hypothetical protein